MYGRAYLIGTTAYMGAWSQGWVIKRLGFVPQNLQESVNFGTPSFSWDLVEGAEAYTLQVDNDPGFGSTDISVMTHQNSYTPISTLANGTYYWRVTAHRNGNVTNGTSIVKSFTLTLPVPTGLTPDDPQAQNAIATSPTLCWNHLIVPATGDKVLAAYRYRVIISRNDPTFSVIYDSADTEQACWTPTKGYDDSTYYWKVAMYDGQGRLGDYSTAAVFTKQYPTAVPKSPTSGSTAFGTPTFTWTAADLVTPYVLGAAAYRLEISLYPTFSSLYDSVTTNNTRYTPNRLYAVNKLYYWRVAIVDADGKLGPFSDATILLRKNAFEIFLPYMKR